MAAAVALAGGPALAAVLEPNGTSVPAAAPASETTLQAYFNAEQENINAVADAATDPGAFLPLCDFKATLVLSQSSAGGGIAWYNTTTGATGTPVVHQIGPFPMLVGQTIASTDVRTDPAYTGGLIGLVLIKNLGQPTLSNVYYSEYQRNANCTGCTMPGYWKMALAYRSTRYPNSYYLAFEDWEGANNTSWQGNDGDFNDKVFRIDGVICEGGGEPCETTMPGVCAQGVTECQVGAGIICKPAIGKTAEKCDNLDNDCNGMVDDGANLCANGFVCSKGVCIRPCDDSEFPCAVGLRCDTDGLCKDPRCADMDCEAGKVCQAGVCVGGCDASVKCPLGQVCQLGVCVDPCAGVACPGAVCEMGACISACGCRACATGQVCVSAGPLNGHCVDTGCDTMTCPTGTVCVRGACADACAGASCPGGAACRNGMCDAAPPVTPTGMGGMGGSSGAGGFVLTGRGGTTGTGGSSAGSGGRGGSADAGVTGAGGVASDAPRGRINTCGCAVSDTSAAGSLLFVIGAIVLARRRRR